MRLLAGLLAAIVLTASMTPAFAQPIPRPAPTPTPTPTPAPAPAPTPVPAPPAAPPEGIPVPEHLLPPTTPPIDSPELVALYEDAYRHLIAGQFAAAAAKFASVVARTVEPTRASAARELGRLAEELATRKAKLVLPEAPGTPVPGRPGYYEDEDDGRISFVVTTTMASIYAGVVLVDLSDTDDVRAGTLMVTGTTAAGFLGSYFITKGRTMTGGMADASSLGLFAGMANAGLLIVPTGLDDESSETIQSLLLGAGVVGGVAGLLYGDQVRPTRGQVSFAGSLGVISMASTLFVLGIAQPETSDGDTFLALLAGTLDAGIAGGLLIARDLDWSTSRARLVNLGTFLGLLAGGSAGVLITGTDAEGDDLRVVAATTLVGMLGGLGLTWRWTRDMKPDPRFQAPAAAAPTTALVPMLTHGGGGLALGGTF